MVIPFNNLDSETYTLYIHCCKQRENIMFCKLVISNFIDSAAKAKAAYQTEKALSMTKVFLQCVKSLKKTGVKLRESMLLNGDGKVVVRDSGVVSRLTARDIMVSGDLRTVNMIATTTYWKKSFSTYKANFVIVF